MIIHGDSMEELKNLADGSIDSVVTDPPYGISFMGKKWDYDVPSVELWREVLRVLKPGGHMLAFGGTRTYHRLVINIEDAGFEIRDQIQWIFGQGFPKSHNGEWGGTALKPANEPICLARKPLEGTVANNFLKHGVGGLNIDGCRVDLNGDYKSKPNGRPSLTKLGDNYNPDFANKSDDKGRFPANLILDEEAAQALDEQSGVTKSKASKRGDGSGNRFNGSKAEWDTVRGHNDFGGASRFFYVAKASKSERNAGLEGMPERESGVKNSSGRGFSESDPMRPVMNQNHHPTVKPIKLMRYLCRLITPPGGTVLDPFLGSGSTLVAAKLEGFKGIGIERDLEYSKIAIKRLEAAAEALPI